MERVKHNYLRMDLAGLWMILGWQSLKRQKDIFQANERKKLTHPNLLEMPDFSTHIIQKENNQMDFLVSGYYHCQ